MSAVVTLRALTRDNWQDCVALAVRDEQCGLLESNAVSIAESRFYDSMLPLAIYADDVMVGFVMYAQQRDPREGNYWIHRLMIDARHQGRGYGRAALREVLRRYRANPDCRSVWIGYTPGNTPAARLYASLGFMEQGEAPWGGDLVAKLELR